MRDILSVARYLLAEMHPEAAVLDREGEVLIAPNGAPDGDQPGFITRFRQAIVALEAGEKFAVLAPDSAGAPPWRLQPIRDGERVVAVVAIPRADGRSRHQLAAIAEDLELGGSLIRVSDVDDSETASIEFSNRAADVASGGPVRQFCRRGSVEAGDQPGTWAIGAFNLEITEHKQAERALAEFEASFREAVEHLDEIVWTATPELELTYVSPAYERIWGRPVDTAYSRPGGWLDAIVPDDRDRVVESWQDPNHRLEYRIRRPDGSVRWIVSKSYPVRDDGGRILRCVGTAADITERKQAELALAESEERFRVALKNTPIIVFNQDLDLRYTWVNRVEPGFAIRDLLGKRDLEIMERPQDAKAIEAIKRRVIETGIGTREEISIHVGDDLLVYDLTVEPLRDRDGEVVGITCASTNITPIYRAAEKQRAELESLVAEKTHEVQLLAKVVTDSANAIFVKDLSGRIIDMNLAAEQQYGWTRSELVGKSIKTLAPPAEHALRDELLDRCVRGENVVGVELSRVTKSGEVLSVLLTLTLLSDDSGEPIGIAAISEDITQHKHAEEQVRESESRLRQMAEQSRDVLWLQEAETGKLIYCTPAYERIWGRSLEELYDKPQSWLMAIVPDDRPRIVDAYNRLLDGEPLEEEYRIAHPDGSLRWVLGRGVPVRDDGGRIYRLAGSAVDITQQKYTETRLQAVLDTASEAIIAIDERGIIESANPALARLLGYTPQEVVGQNVSMLMTERDRARYDGHLARYFMTGEASVIGAGREVLGRSRAGEEIPLHLQVAETAVNGQRMFVGLLRDIRPEKRVQEALQSQAALIEQISDAVIATDMSFCIHSWNRAAEEIYGYRADEAIGKTIPELLVTEMGESRDRVVNTLMTKGRWRGEVVQRKRDGSRVQVRASVVLVRDLDGNPSGVVAVNSDVTEFKRLERESAHGQKMEAVGLLANGVAHDFNNLLMGISGCANIALSTLSPGSPACMYLDEIKKSADSGAAISRQLLAFSRSKPMELTAFELGEAIADVTAMLRRLLGEDIDLVVRADPGNCRVRMDRGQMEQILMNLAVNARDAMPRGGRLVVETRRLVLPDRNEYSLPASAYVALAITDTGCGMTEEIQRRIFEPFFTTKEVGKGTGLGLATVYAIVTRAEGRIEVSSEPNKGTTFQILLPASDDSPVEEPTADATGEPGNGTILVVEDERLVRMAMRFYLEKGGYRVLEADSGRDAIESFRKHRDDIRLLLTDIVLPGMNGTEIARQFRGMKPDIEVIFISAHEPAWLASEGRIDHPVQAIQKPFDQAMLLSRVNRVLGQVPGTEKRKNRPTDRAAAVPRAVGTRDVEASESGSATRPPATARSRADKGPILVVEDQPAALLAMEALLTENGWHVMAAKTGDQALEMARQCDIAALLTDYSLSDTKGDRLARAVKQIHPDIHVAYMSGFPHLELDPPGPVFTKPIDLDALLAALESL